MPRLVGFFPARAGRPGGPTLAGLAVLAIRPLAYGQVPVRSPVPGFTERRRLGDPRLVAVRHHIARAVAVTGGVGRAVDGDARHREGELFHDRALGEPQDEAPLAVVREGQ